MGRDLVSSPYGRFFHLPRHLAAQGHQVQLLLLDYRHGAPVAHQAHGFDWLSVPFSPRHPLRYLHEIERTIRGGRPDCIVGLSDTYYGMLAVHFSRRHGCCSAIDAYDNYESYLPWCKPLHWRWRRALRRADLLTAAGPGLAALMSSGRPGRAAVVVPMAPDPIGFVPLDRAACRQRMGLPLQRKLVGYCGSMHRSRGVEVLFDAFACLQAGCPDAMLVHSGRTWRNVPLPDEVHSLGYIEDALMPVLLNCMDVLVVTNRRSAFGDYSYPVKLYEAMSCRVPVVATRTPATAWILGDASPHLVPPADPQALCAALEWALQQDAVDYGVLPDWDSSGRRLEQALLETLSRGA